MTSAQLKALRESLGLSQQWLADQSNVQKRTVAYWESGRNQVPEDVSDIILSAAKDAAKKKITNYPETFARSIFGLQLRGLLK